MTDQINIIIHSKDSVLEELPLENGNSISIESMEGLTYEVKNTSSGTAPEEFILERHGDNLELYLTSESVVPEVIFEDYYVLDNPSPLVGMAEDGQFYTYVPQSGKEELLAWNLEDDDSTYQSLGYETVGSAVPWWPILLAGLLLLGGAAAVAAAKSDDDDDDNTAPDAATGSVVSDDGTEVSGNGEAGSTVIIIDPDGTEIGTGTVGDDGTFVVDIDPEQTDGEELEVVLVDGSGNESVPAPAQAPDITGLVAASNAEEVVVVAEPSRTPGDDQSKTIVSVLNVGVGEIVDVALGDLSDLNSMLVTVDSNTEKSLTLGVSGGGVVVGSTYDLYIYKENTLNGTWELQDDYTVEDWFTTILLVGGVAPDQDITLPEGNYRVALNTQGVDVVGVYTLTAENVEVLDYSTPIDAVGEYSGNVIDDLDINSSNDTATPTTTVKSVEFNGEVFDVTTTRGETTEIIGNYGTLTIDSHGDYTYELDGTQFVASPAYDETDVFTYTIEDLANPSYTESSAELSIQIVREASEPVIVAETVVMTISEPTVGTSSDTIDPITNIETVGVALGPVLNVDVLPDDTHSMSISVAEDTFRTVTFEATSFGLAVGAEPKDLLIYREDESTGNYVLVHTEESWFTFVLVAGVGSALELTLPPGEYLAVLQGELIGVGVASVTTLSVTEDITTDYTESTATGSQSGNIDVTELLAVEGTLFDGGVNQNITGEYGTLSINSDGSYIYKLDYFSADEEKPYGEMESFSYMFEKDGEISKGRLNIKIDGAEITDDTITTDSLTGNLFANDIVAGDAESDDYWSEMVIGGEHMYVQGTLGNGSVEIVLDSGTLTVEHNGDYTFVADGAGTDQETVDYTLTSLFGETYQGSIDIIPEAPVAAAAMSFESFDDTESTDNTDDGDNDEVPSMDELVDTSEGLSFEGDPVAGSSVVTEEPTLDAYAPLTDSNDYLEDDAATGASLV